MSSVLLQLKQMACIKIESSDFAAIEKTKEFSDFKLTNREKLSEKCGGIA